MEHLLEKIISYRRMRLMKKATKVTLKAKDRIDQSVKTITTNECTKE